jgi:hypothetical protein
MINTESIKTVGRDLPTPPLEKQDSGRWWECKTVWFAAEQVMTFFPFAR